MLKKITSVQEFEQAINQPVVLMEFFQPWCHFCQAFQPTLEQFGEMGIVPSYQTSGEEFPQIFEAYNIESYPTLIMFRSGKPVLKEEGGMTIDQLQNFVAQAETVE